MLGAPASWMSSQPPARSTISGSHSPPVCRQAFVRSAILGFGDTPHACKHPRAFYSATFYETTS